MRTPTARVHWTGLCDYSVGNGAANWGTRPAIAQTEAAARIVYAGYGRVAVGDVALEHGGRIARPYLAPARSRRGPPTDAQGERPVHVGHELAVHHL